MYDLVKVFDFGAAPSELQQCPELAPLCTAASADERTVLMVRVGDYSMSTPEDCTLYSPGEVTMAEYLLDQWLFDQGAQKGEEVFVLSAVQQPARRQAA